MTCAPLPATGLGANVELLLVLALVLLMAGASLLLLARRARRGGPAVVVLALLLGTGTITATLGLPEPAQAAGSGCSTSASSDDRLSVVQTSTMVGLAPGVAPAPIIGRLVNHSDESTRVSAVDVTITGVTPSPSAPTGACGPSDYRLIASRMPVGRTLQPGGTTPFAGAAIAFSNKSSNQDACKRATIHLLYTANPGQAAKTG